MNKKRILVKIDKIKDKAKKRILSVTIFIFILINSFILSIDFFITPPLKLGEKSSKNIEAPRSIVYIDKDETNRIKTLLLSQFKPIYKIDQNITINALRKLNEIFKNHYGISEKSKKYLSSISLSKLNTIIERTEIWLSETYSKGISKDNIEIRKNELISFLKREFNFPPYLSEEITQIVLESNMYIDEKETELKKQELLKSIKPIEKLISKGDIIVKRGEIIDEEKYKILDTLGLTNSFNNIIRTISLVSLVILFQISQRLFYFMFTINSDLNIFILSQVLFSLGLLLIKLFSIISPYLSPLASVFFLSSTTLNVSYSILMNFQLSILFGLINNSFLLLLIPIFNFLIISYFLKEIEDRTKFIKIAFYLFLNNIILIILFNFLTGDYKLETSEILSVFVNPFLSTILALGLLPFLENIFRVATPLRLLELSNPNYHLLHKLFLEAPGTYYHSLIVGNLAERAAEASNANTYLVRVASLYHDIGKIKRPQYFIENLMPGQTNPHNSLNPYISALIIKNHTNEGAQIANNYKFPKSIIDIIEQHHGTSLITYFYYKQKEISKTSVPEEDFRYLGPKPKSKEAAIVMLADNIEAATRSLNNPAPETIEKVVRKIINEKITDGQLENANLTLEELEKISQSFIKTLLSLRHPRIPYPQEEKLFKNKKEAYWR
ncbi:MAG: HDIG domain-containing protein [Dictyoglomaceae bacterium]|nr:HDIG domain-containing protein [Dictyoglomaceae bacterium]